MNNESKYYYQSNNQAHGPISVDKIKALLDSGLITIDTMVAKEGDQQWVALGTIQEQISQQISPPIQKTKKKHYWPIYTVILFQIITVIALSISYYAIKTSVSRVEEAITLSRKSRQLSEKANKIEKKDNAVVEDLYNFAAQQIDKNHDEAIRSLNESNKDAHIKLDYQAELLQMGSDKIKRLTQDQFLLGGISASKKREEIEKLEQQDKEDKLMIKKRRAEENFKTSTAKVNVAEESVRRLLELRRKAGKSEK